MLARLRASGPRFPSGRKPQIDAIGQAPVGVRREQPHHFLDDAVEDFAVGYAAAAAGGFAVVVVDEHEVDVAGIVQLVAAELAERQRGDARRLTVRAGRRAEAIEDGAERVLECDFDRGIGQTCQFAGHFFQRAVADDVVDADPQRVPVAEAAKGPQDADIVRGGIDLRAELCG